MAANDKTRRAADFGEYQHGGSTMEVTTTTMHDSTSKRKDIKMSTQLQNLIYDPYDGKDRTKNPNGLLVRTYSDVDFLKSLPREKVACVDIETTGLNPGGNDEILQVSICDGNGSILLDSYVHPEHRKRWPKAQEINHITWSMVKDAPTIEELAERIDEIFASCELLIGYNILRFDLPFLHAARIDVPRGKRVYDLIYDASVLHGRWSDYHVNYSFVKLESVTRTYGIDYDAHDSAQDVIATAKLFYAMLDGSAMTEKIDYYERKAAERLEKEQEKKRLDDEMARSRQEDVRRADNNALITCGVILVLVLVMILVTCGGMCSR